VQGKLSGEEENSASIRKKSSNFTKGNWAPAKKDDIYKKETYLLMRVVRRLLASCKKEEQSRPCVQKRGIENPSRKRPRDLHLEGKRRGGGILLKRSIIIVKKGDFPFAEAGGRKRNCEETWLEKNFVRERK